MEPATAALIILIIGIILLICEALNPGVFLVIPGTVLVIIGIIGYMVPNFLFSMASPITALVIAVPVTLLTIWIYRKLGKTKPPTTSVSDALLGKYGKVIKKTTPDNLKGKVKIGSEIWSANSSEDIEEGADVVVIATEGVHVVVKKIEG